MLLDTFAAIIPPSELVSAAITVEPLYDSRATLYLGPSVSPSYAYSRTGELPRSFQTHEQKVVRYMAR